MQTHGDNRFYTKELTLFFAFDIIVVWYLYKLAKIVIFARDTELTYLVMIWKEKK